MSHSSNMIKRLQPFQRKSVIYKAIFDAESIQFDSHDADVADLVLQLSVDSATWALTIYEQELGIPTDISKPLSDRRSVVKSKMRGTGKVDAVLIKVVADSYTNGDVAVSFDGAIQITFVSVRGIPPNLSDVEAAIRDIIPAHLAVSYTFTYLTWDELDAAAKTWDQWDALGLTWDQMEIYKP